MPSRTHLETDADRFWSKVDRSGECWTWLGAKDTHGYGRVVVGGEVLKAHRLAWFMVMGTMPKHGLYHIAPGRPWSHSNPGADSVRGCVRPHHFRDGPPESAPTRWAKRAQSGFPPEFRSITEHLMPTEQAESDLLPLLLYRGALTIGRAQAMFNFTMAAQAAEAERLGDVTAMSRAWPDVSHAVGLHKPITATQSVGRFWDRLLQHPAITDTRPGMREYIRGVMADSRWRSIRLEPIDRYSPWSTRAWRKLRIIREPIEAIPEVWPFLPTDSASHDLVTVVDAAVPKAMPEHVRQDVCQDLVLAVLEGEIAIADLAAQAGPFIKRVFRQYPTKYGPLSLDAPRGDHDDFTLLDTLADAPIILGANGAETLRELRDRLAEEEAA